MILALSLALQFRNCSSDQRLVVGRVGWLVDELVSWIQVGLVIIHPDEFWVLVFMAKDTASFVCRLLWPPRERCVCVRVRVSCENEN